MPEVGSENIGHVVIFYTATTRGLHSAQWGCSRMWWRRRCLLEVVPVCWGRGKGVVINKGEGGGATKR